MSDSDGSAPAYRTMREIASDERPRERLLHHGPETLSDAELLAVLLGSGRAGENVVDLARSLLEESGGLAGIVRSDGKELQRRKGLGPAKAAQVAAAIELGRRIQEIDPASRPSFATPEAVFAYFGPRLGGRAGEELHVAAVDPRSRLLARPSRVHGTSSAVPVQAAEVFREAIVLRANGVVLVHNHPSGDPRPSPQDVTVTKGLVAAGELLGITVLDHVIVGQGNFVSMKREGYWR
jgi:DNA repair protein RadC